MLSERITKLFELLQCSNTDIARCAGAAPSNVSRLKSGAREPRRDSRPIRRLAEGVYRYAEEEDLLPVLRELCKTEDDSPEHMIPGIVSWLFQDHDADLPQPVPPKSKRIQAQRRWSFGERLNQAMNLLDLSNRQLAAQMNVDESLISKYRTGSYYPHGNWTLAEILCDALIACARQNGQTDALAALCLIPIREFNAGSLAKWLHATKNDAPTALAETLLRSVDAFTPGQGLPPAAPRVPAVETAERYFGTEGLRSAVIRFLTDAAREGGELMLYSDEPMDWMSGDREYFALWAWLMVECVKGGVRIKIIHNVDRNAKEMVDAITGWFPLYVSGMIEPFLFRKERNARFCHTVFLRRGAACILGHFPSAAKESRWYDYVTDGKLLEMTEDGYNSMLEGAAPFLKTYTAARREDFARSYVGHPGERTYLLSDFPAATMPERLLERMLLRAEIDEARREEILAVYRGLRQDFTDALARGSVDMILCRQPGPETPRAVNFAADLMELPLYYTREEYAGHVAAILELVEREQNFRLTLLPFAPFQDIQILALKDAVAVMRGREPQMAFAFTSAQLTQSVSDYFSALIDQYGTDRLATIRALESLKEG